MLRHYQEHAVLMPAFVDEHTGRRFYNPAQLGVARLVVQLRDAGFSVDEIAILSDADAGHEKVHAALDAQRAELFFQREALHERVRALDHVAITLKGKPAMTKVSTVVLPEMTIASLRRTLPSYGDEGVLWEEIMPLLVEVGATFPAEATSGATFHDPDFHESDVDVEVWIQVAARFERLAELDCVEMPEREVVTATVRGDYSQMSAVTEALGAYIAEHGLSTGPMFNIYRVSPAQNPDPSSWVTEVCFPILEN